MPISSINRVKTITVDLNSATGNNIVTIYQNSGVTIGDELIPGYTVISLNCFLKNLKAFAKIQSLEESPLPDFDVEDSATDKLYKTLDVEWKSPRKQLSLYIASGNQDWSQVGSISLLNPYGYPFRVYNLMDLYTDNLALELGDNSRIGIGVDEVSYGLLAEEDLVTIHGSYVEEIFVQSPTETNYINVPVIIPPITVNVGSNTQIEQPSTSYLINNSSNIDNVFLVNN
jgi:hypothetical protein